MLASSSSVIALFFPLIATFSMHLPSHLPQYDQGQAVVSATQVAIQDVSIGSDVTQVKQTFGKAVFAYDAEDGVTGKKGTDIMFEGVRIYLLDDKVVNLQCWSTRYSTADGLKVGDGVAKALGLYGIGDAATSAAETSIRYHVPGSKNYLLLHFNKGVLFKIELWCDY